MGLVGRRRQTVRRSDVSFGDRPRRRLLPTSRLPARFGQETPPWPRSHEELWLWGRGDKSQGASPRAWSPIHLACFACGGRKEGARVPRVLDHVRLVTRPLSRRSADTVFAALVDAQDECASPPSSARSPVTEPPSQTKLQHSPTQTSRQTYPANATPRKRSAITLAASQRGPFWELPKGSHPHHATTTTTTHPSMVCWRCAVPAARTHGPGQGGGVWLPHSPRCGPVGAPFLEEEGGEGAQLVKGCPTGMLPGLTAGAGQGCLFLSCPLLLFILNRWADFHR